MDESLYDISKRHLLSSRKYQAFLLNCFLLFGVDIYIFDDVPISVKYLFS